MQTVNSLWTTGGQQIAIPILLNDGAYFMALFESSGAIPSYTVTWKSCTAHSDSGVDSVVLLSWLPDSDCSCQQRLQVTVLKSMHFPKEQSIVFNKMHGREWRELSEV